MAHRLNLFSSPSAFLKMVVLHLACAGNHRGAHSPGSHRLAWRSHRADDSGGGGDGGGDGARDADDAPVDGTVCRGRRERRRSVTAGADAAGGGAAADGGIDGGGGGGGGGGGCGGGGGGCGGGSDAVRARLRVRAVDGEWLERLRRSGAA